MDKNALLGAIAVDGFRLLTQALRAARAGPPKDHFRESGWAYVRFALAHPAHVAVMFGNVIDAPADCTGLPEKGATAFDVLVEIIEEGQQAGRLRSGDSRTLALAAWSLVHGLASLVSESGPIPPADAEPMTRALTEILFNGMKGSVSPGEEIGTVQS